MGDNVVTAVIPLEMWCFFWYTERKRKRRKWVVLLHSFLRKRRLNLWLLKENQITKSEREGIA